MLSKLPFLRSKKHETKECYPQAITATAFTPVDEFRARLRLYENFERLYKVHSKTSHGFNATMFAVIMIAPLSPMRDMLESIRQFHGDQRDPENPITLLLYAMYTAPEAVRSCIPNRRPAMATSSTVQQQPEPSPAAQAPPLTNPFRRNIAHIPENQDVPDVCLFTDSRDAEKADIFPLCTTIGDAFQPLDALLTCFWGERIRDRWASQVTDPHVIESPRNFLPMSRELHYWWDNAAIGLKPLAESANEIVVQWHWLQGSCLSPRTIMPRGIDHAKYVSRHVSDSWGSMKHVFGKKLQTGQVFTLRVEGRRQLPSYELLELQWDLLRVAAISGASNFNTSDPFYDAEKSEESL